MTQLFSSSYRFKKDVLTKMVIDRHSTIWTLLSSIFSQLRVTEIFVHLTVALWL